MHSPYNSYDKRKKNENAAVDSPTIPYAGSPPQQQLSPVKFRMYDESPAKRRHSPRKGRKIFGQQLPLRPPVYQEVDDLDAKPKTWKPTAHHHHHHHHGKPRKNRIVRTVSKAISTRYFILFAISVLICVFPLIWMHKIAVHTTSNETKHLNSNTANNNEHDANTGVDHQLPLPEPETRSEKRKRRRKKRRTETLYKQSYAKRDRSSIKKKKNPETQNRLETALRSIHQRRSQKKTLDLNALNDDKFLVAWVLIGCDPDKPPTCQGLLHNILISAENMRLEETVADLVVFVRMSPDSLYPALMPEDSHMMGFVNIKIKYLENAAPTDGALEKFVVWQETDYSRVLYLDPTVMVKGSLDYLFMASMSGVLQPNVIVAADSGPASTNLFLIQPSQIEYDRLSTLRDWSHKLSSKYEYYESFTKQVKVKGWHFESAKSDAGLLYHMMRYEKKAFSVLHKDSIQNWGVPKQEDSLKPEKYIVLTDLLFPTATKHECWEDDPMDSRPCFAPHSDFYDFGKSTSKPWLLNGSSPSNVMTGAIRYWFDKRSTLNNKYGIGLEETPPVQLEAVNTVGKFAYAYVVGGCDPDRPSYRHFLYQILINVKLQRKEGSKADTVIFVQLSNVSSQNELPEKDLAVLKKMQVKVEYIPKSKDESFDAIVMEKFRVLGLTQYDRVLFLDSDLMTRGSLDYLFDLSMKGSLQHNVIFAHEHSPAAGSIFMVAPAQGSWDRLQSIVKEKEERGANLPFPHFDTIKGWGEAMGENKYELETGRTGSEWDFLGANADQGLIYHWTKFEEKSVTIVMNDTVQNWATTDSGDLIQKESLSISTIDGQSRHCWEDTLKGKPCTAPHSDYIHFHGTTKPWLHAPPDDLSAETSNGNPRELWFRTLSELNDELNMGIDFASWATNERPLLGLHPHHIDDVVPEPKETGSASKFAYAYVVGGVDPAQPAYRNFLYNIAINSRIQRDAGSKADVVVFVQMAFASAIDQLPKDDVQMLHSLGVRIRYVPKVEDESLERLMLEKFRILSLVEYERVLYLDADLMVRASMDYIFELSMEGALKENIIVNGEHQPAVGSLFMVAPNEGDWDRILEVIEEKETREAESSTPGKFDEKLGWGQAFEEDDGYGLTDGTRHDLWDFRGASRDPGLLYHWMKYEKKSVSILGTTMVQQLGPNDKGRPIIERADSIELFASKSQQQDCWKDSTEGKPCIVPYSDFVHFHGATKPFLIGPPTDLSKETITASPVHYWFDNLYALDNELNLNIDFKKWPKDQRPLLGIYSSDNDMSGTTYHRSKIVALKYVDSQARFAYAYVIGGAKPEDPSYRNYLNDIMVSTYVQREEGSTADVVVFIQMAFVSEHETLPAEDLNFLNAMNIRVKYIPKAEDESFYRITLDKFLILGLTEYERVLFMDGDVVTRGNLDYMFDLSVRGVLKENVVVAGSTEPANAGFFMLKPKSDSSERINKIIKDKEARTAKLPYPHWDEKLGWGHAFEGEDDFYELASGKKVRKWDFYCAFSDQGLLYHWVKYEEKNVSVVMKNKVVNYGENPDTGKVVMTDYHSLESIFGNATKREYCWRGFMKTKPCHPPHSDFVHFTGKSKPWLNGPPDDLEQPPSEERGAAHFWFHHLWILNDKLDMGLDFKNWKTGHKPLLGLFPTLTDAKKTASLRSVQEADDHSGVV